jgi:hypothetical protein
MVYRKEMFYYQDNQVGLKLNGTHQLLAYPEDVNLQGDNINTINKDTETLIGVSKEREEAKYMLVSRDQNAGHNRDIKIGNRSFENVSQFRYLGTTVQTNKFRGL